MAKNICARVGERIRVLRMRRRWRQIDLAEHADVSQKHISDVESGKTETGLLTLERIALALNVAPAELLQFDSPPPVKR
jgi:transcriptional regulator with XRE-family HTH domain